MKVLVRHNNPIKAYKVLMRKIREEGCLKELRDKQFFKSKGEILRENKKKGIQRSKKREQERQALFEYHENRPRKKVNNNGRKSRD